MARTSLISRGCRRSPTATASAQLLNPNREPSESILPWRAAARIKVASRRDQNTSSTASATGRRNRSPSKVSALPPNAEFDQRRIGSACESRQATTAYPAEADLLGRAARSHLLTQTGGRREGCLPGGFDKFAARNPGLLFCFMSRLLLRAPGTVGKRRRLISASGCVLFSHSKGWEIPFRPCVPSLQTRGPQTLGKPPDSLESSPTAVTQFLCKLRRFRLHFDSMKFVVAP